MRFGAYPTTYWCIAFRLMFLQMLHNQHHFTGDEYHHMAPINTVIVLHCVLHGEKTRNVLSNTISIFVFKRTSWQQVADLGGGGAQGTRPPGQNFSIFMQFSGKIGQTVSWRLLSPPPPREILDPSLVADLES